MNEITRRPMAIVCDLDGTLCLFDGRGPFEMERCGTDMMNVPVERLLRILHDKGQMILLVSGRFEQYRPQTETWLRAHGLHWYDALYLRADGDYRKDTEIKRELYEQRIKPYYDVWLSLDDRNQSVECWRALDIPCFQVAPGDF